jgi:transaldolase
VAAGAPVDAIASVASFFVSRVDAKADALLPRDSQLRGRVAIANARAAYSRFRACFRAERWRPLSGAGARPQRPLWASTGTKDPAYRDVLYVEALTGPDVVSTMPEATLRAFADHGDVGPAMTRDAGTGLQALVAEAGIDLDAITVQLEREGVRSFCDSYHELLACIQTKVEPQRARGHKART